MNDIRFKLNEVRGKISFFKKEPILDREYGNLRNALMILNDIHISGKNLSSEEFEQYRLEILRYHVDIVWLFNKYYIENYKPKKPYYMQVFPPDGSVDGIVFGTIDPARIKDKTIREKYKLDLAENKRDGEELSFQDELLAVKNILEAPSKNSGSIATLEFFIKAYYKNNSFDKTEVEKVINESELKNDLKSRILDDTVR
ncbi:hypothetical protein [Escherichia sp. E4385]|uniref:hypothetical protein n=1 Tax=Escherichia sp. E4385 TaxID=2040639 RepID=UPI0010FE93EC|nr:hypothetical protein [Escherichia sp. E4385]TLI93723.1 hypothetical protein FEK49_23965 [Escherichia sp. E4385]